MMLPSRLSRLAWNCLALAVMAFLFSALAAPGQDKKPPAKKEEKKKPPAKEGKKEPPKKVEKMAVPLATLKGHTDWVNQVAFSADGKLLASAGRDHTVRVWDPGAKKEIKIFKNLPENKTVAFLTGDRLAAGTGKWNKKAKAWEGKIEILDLKTGKETTYFKGHADAIEALAVSKDGKTMASAGKDQTIILRDPTSGKELKVLKGHTGAILGLAFSKDGSKLASASADKTVKIWDVAAGKDLLTLKNPLPKVPEKKIPEKKAPEKKVPPKKVPPKKAPPKGKAQPKPEPPLDPTRDMTCVAFSPPGDRLAAGNLDGTVKVFDTASGKKLLDLKAGDGVWAVAFSPDGKKLAAAGWDKRIYIWDPQSGKEVRSFLAHDNTVTSLVFSPDGQRLVSASLDQTVKIWDAAKK